VAVDLRALHPLPASPSVWLGRSSRSSGSMVATPTLGASGEELCMVLTLARPSAARLGRASKLAGVPLACGKGTHDSRSQLGELHSEFPSAGFAQLEYACGIYPGGYAAPSFGLSLCSLLLLPMSFCAVSGTIVTSLLGHWW
jgi:hypothetical protein